MPMNEYKLRPARPCFTARSSKRSGIGLSTKPPIAFSSTMINFWWIVLKQLEIAHLSKTRVQIRKADLAIGQSVFRRGKSLQLHPSLSKKTISSYRICLPIYKIDALTRRSLVRILNDVFVWMTLNVIHTVC